MRITEIGTSATVIAGGDYENPGKISISVDQLCIANVAATATNVSLYACNKSVDAADAVNRFIIDYEIPATDTLFVFDGNSFDLQGGETIQAKADDVDYLRAFSFEHVKNVEI